MTNLSYGIQTNVIKDDIFFLKTRDALNDQYRHTNSNIRFFKETFIVKLGSLDKIVNAISSVLTSKDRVKRSDFSELTTQLTFTLHIAGGPHSVYVMVDLDVNNQSENKLLMNSEEDETAQVVEIKAFGEEATLLYFKNFIKKTFSELPVSKTSFVKWIVDQYNSSTFSIKKDWFVDDSFYPNLGRHLLDYYQAFKNSQSQILITFGSPGTGKTTFIRDMICELGINAIITYDVKLLVTDDTYIDFLQDPLFNSIIIEDADEILTANRNEYNKAIAKLLNVSDGIVKLPRKKIIISTNLNNVSDIDKAIIRPGRCFDLLEFKSLSNDEAKVVAEKLGISIGDKKSYTLAELFMLKSAKDNNDPIVTESAKRLERKVGF